MSENKPGIQSHQPYIQSTIAILIVIVATLCFTLFLTRFISQWTFFLTGILLASIISSLLRVKLNTLLEAQLEQASIDLEYQIKCSKKVEEELASTRQLLNILDTVPSLMVAFVDSEGRYQYHNHSFGEWMNLSPERINGRYMREVLGVKDYGDIAAAVRQSLGGQAAHYERKRRWPNGSLVRVSVEHVPQFNEDKKPTGFYILATVIAEGEEKSPSIASGLLDAGVRIKGQDIVSIDPSVDRENQDLYVKSISEQFTGKSDDGSEVLAAIERGEFSLYCQRIVSLQEGSATVMTYEILLRLMEEEFNRIPPGAFLPIAEKHGLMPYLDRWVVRRTIEYIVLHNLHLEPHRESLFFINLSLATLIDPGFQEFLRRILLEYGVQGSFLCFEVPAEYASREADLAEFAQQAKLCGCYIALSGFGRDRVTFERIHGIHVDFLKIDGTVIMGVINDTVKLAKVIAIDQVAKKIGVKTVAELVESEEIIVKLRKIGIDLAQGYGISRPLPLDEIGSS